MPGSGGNTIGGCSDALVVPTITKAFSPTSITAGGVSRLTITLNNANASLISLTAALTDTLPAGVLIAATPTASTTCTGTVTATAGSSTVSLATGSTIPAAGSCTVSVNVTSAVAGSHVNTIAVGALQTSSGNNAVAATATLAVTCPVITLAPATLPNGTVGTAYSQTITGSGGTAPYGFTVASGTLPAGMTLTAAGVLAGTPTTVGVSTFTLRGTDANGCFADLAYTVTIAPAGCPVITLAPATLPNGTVGVAWSQTLTASGGTAPYTYTLTAGTLPTGLALTTAGGLGLISGTPTAAGSSTFTIRATDAVGCFTEIVYTQTIAAVPPVPTMSQWALIALGALLLLGGALVVRSQF
jgi:hypothetical protein